jgi:hypothetical protein
MSCVDSTGYQDAAVALKNKRFTALLIAEAVPVIAALDAAANAKDIFDQRNAISQRQMDLAEEQLAFNQLAWPCEEATISEAQTATPYVANYDMEVGKAQVPIRAEFAKLRIKINKTFNRYNTGARNATFDRICVAEQVAISDAKMLAYMAETAQKDSYDDRDWNRRVEMSALGRNVAGQASGFYSSAGQGLASLQSSAISQFNNAIGAFGTAFNQYANASPYVQSQFLQQEDVSGIQGRVYDDFQTQTEDAVVMAAGESAFESSQELSGSGVLDMPMTGEAFGGGVGNMAGTSIMADSTVKEVKVQGRDSRGDRIDITVSGSNIIYTNAKDNDTPVTTITGY